MTHFQLFQTLIAYLRILIGAPSHGKACFLCHHLLPPLCLLFSVFFFSFSFFLLQSFINGGCMHVWMHIYVCIYIYAITDIHHFTTLKVLPHPFLMSSWSWKDHIGNLQTPLHFTFYHSPFCNSFILWLDS